MRSRKQRVPKSREKGERREGSLPLPCSVSAGDPAHIAAMSPGKKVDKSVDMFDLVGKWLAALTEFGEAAMISVVLLRRRE